MVSPLFIRRLPVPVRRSIAAAIITHHPDPVQRALGSVLALIALGIGITGLLVAFVGVLVDLGIISTWSGLVVGALMGVVWLVNRRGSILAPALIITVSAMMIAAVYDPRTYVDVDGFPVIHVAFIVPALLASLLIGPFMGYPVLVASVLLIGMRAIADGYASDLVQRFVVIAIIDLAAVNTIAAAVGAFLRGALAREAGLSTELEQRVAERTAELDTLHRSWQDETAQVTHDLRNLIGVTTAEIDLLLDDLRHDELRMDALADVLNRILDGQDLQAGLVSDLHTLSVLKANPAALVIEPCEYDLVARIRRMASVLRSYAEAAAIELSLDLPERLIIVADPTRIDRVVLNLVANAIKFTGAYRANGGAITVRASADTGYALLEIIDNGIGISAAGLEKIGGRWVRERRDHRMPPGTGLGLNFSTAMVDLFHGDLTVTSPGENRGTIVRVRLPLAPGM